MRLETDVTVYYRGYIYTDIGVKEEYSYSQSGGIGPYLRRIHVDVSQTKVYSGVSVPTLNPEVGEWSFFP